MPWISYIWQTLLHVHVSFHAVARNWELYVEHRNSPKYLCECTIRIALRIRNCSTFTYTCFRLRIFRLCDGTRALEDLAVIYDLMPDELHYMLIESGKFKFISKWSFLCASRVRFLSVLPGRSHPSTCVCPMLLKPPKQLGAFLPTREHALGKTQHCPWFAISVLCVADYVPWLGLQRSLNVQFGYSGGALALPFLSFILKLSFFLISRS